MFKKMFNYLILSCLIYLVFIHNTENLTKKKKKKNKKNNDVNNTDINNTDVNNTDVNSLIDSVMEEEIFSHHITEEAVQNSMNKNKSVISDDFYKKYDDFYKKSSENKEHTDNLLETNVDEYYSDQAFNKSTLSEESENSINKSESLTASMSRSKSTRMINLKKKHDNTSPKSIKQVFEENIIDFKKNNKLSKKEKTRIQGKINTNDVQNNKFTTFECDSESPYDIDIKSNDVHFDNYSLI